MKETIRIFRPFLVRPRSDAPSPRVLNALGNADTANNAESADNAEKAKSALLNVKLFMTLPPELRMKILRIVAHRYPLWLAEHVASAHEQLLAPSGNGVVSAKSQKEHRILATLTPEVAEALAGGTWRLNDDPKRLRNLQGSEVNVAHLFSYLNQFTQKPIMSKVSIIGALQVSPPFQVVLQDEARCAEVKEFFLEDATWLKTSRRFFDAYTVNIDTIIFGWGCQPRAEGEFSKDLCGGFNFTFEQGQETKHHNIENLIVDTRPYADDFLHDCVALANVKNLRKSVVSLVFKCNDLECDLGYYAESQKLETIIVSVPVLDSGDASKGYTFLNLMSDAVRAFMVRNNTVLHLCCGVINPFPAEHLESLVKLYEKHGQKEFHPESIGGPRACHALTRLNIDCYESTMALEEFAEVLSKLPLAAHPEGYAAVVDFCYHHQRRDPSATKILREALGKYFGPEQAWPIILFDGKKE